MNAPVKLQELGLNVDTFKYSDQRSWRGACPVCGGSRRFVIFTDHEYPFWHGYCDECGYKVRAWEKVKVKVKYDPLQAEQMRAEMERQQAEREEQRRKRLAEFSTTELWAELRDRMTEKHIEWWESQGVPEDIQRFLSIGYKADKMYYDAENHERHSPAYTIPYFAYNFQIQTMQYRLIADGIRDRYRFEYGLPGGSSCYYMTDPSETIKDKVIICEGAKKAIVTWFHLSPSFSEYTVLGAASNKTLAPALNATKDCGLRYLILDPGSERTAFMAARDNKNLKAIYLPEKIDDLFMAGQIERAGFSGILRAA